MDWLKALWQAVTKDEPPTTSEVGFACALTLALWLAPSYISHMKPWERLLTYLMGIGVSATYIKRCQELQEQESYDLASRLMQQELVQHQIATEAVYYKQQLSSQFFPSTTQLPAAEMPLGTEQLPPDAAISTELAVRDLTAEMARYEGHILIASRTRSGKTTTIQSAIAHTWQQYAGNVNFWVFDPKGAAFCGIEQTNHYLLCNKPSQVPVAVDRLEKVVAEILEVRQDKRVAQGGHWESAPRAVKVIFDEWNTWIRMAERFDKKHKTDYQGRAIDAIERLIFQGGEDNIAVWLLAQTTRVKQLGLDTSVQDNMAYFAQSRNGDYQSIEDALSNPYVVSNSQQRQRLQHLLAVYASDQTQNRRIPIAFTTLGGNQLCQLPDLCQAKYFRLGEPSSTPFKQANPGEPNPNSSRTEVAPDADERTWLERCLELAFDDVGSTGSTAENTSQTGQNPVNSAPGSPELEFPEIDGLDNDTLRSLIVEYRQHGITGQDAFIKTFWDISKGESRRYYRARERYQSVCRQFGL
ncbi:FtsK/SpoIIIE domain-containing protein [Pantanalinema rosaneae CENA516]|uniref:FtsK/SpoIIIE domain-containing protein n=1 Tax=Pantanalinema rosaneae TaxID=1620701 RepID=UPI003D6FD826